MAQPITLDLPHSLGKARVRERLDSRIGRLGDRIPGGARVEHRWDGDTLLFSVHAMGQEVKSSVTVFDTHVHAVIDLPGLLGLFAGPIRAAIQREAPKLLT
ncbi:polyhydroxyalkanoic acid system family protein [Sphingomonas bacterium]|uniref:polyhydroxyalkanoic acid system family protein n=1 Tax=Sphingomonas bacterium TaxID=1895847 RepID=UPI00157607DA|nr:polyhydroxyalkanoic acid system family protein [Sphingomonas bacterium]